MSRDTSFYYSFLVLPPAKRHAIIAVWDFCRAVDDAVDEVDMSGEREKDGRVTAAAEIARWRRELAACFEGGAPQTRQGRALAPLVTTFGLTRAPFEALIEGVEMDLGPRRYESFADLYEYCIRVASAVGLICLDIFGSREPASRQYAIDLGVALQLTNILRDVRVDLDAGPRLHPAGGPACPRLQRSRSAAGGRRRRRRRSLASREGAPAPSGAAREGLLRAGGPVASAS